MKKLNIQMILMWIFAILPSIVMGVIYDKIPDKVVIHIGIMGDLRYGSKKMLWILCMISIFIAIFFVLLKRKNTKKIDDFNNEYYAIGLAIEIFIFGMIIISILDGFAMNVLPIGNIVIFCSAILFAVVGSVIKNSSNFKPINRWTKMDYDILKKTQKFSGKLFIITSLIMAVGTIFATGLTLFILVIVMLVCKLILPNVMSYIWYKERHKK